MKDVSDDVLRDLTKLAAERMQTAFEIAAGQHLNGRQSAECALKVASAIIGGTVMAVVGGSTLGCDAIEELKKTVLIGVAQAVDKGIEYGLDLREAHELEERLAAMLEDD